MKPLLVTILICFLFSLTSCHQGDDSAKRIADLNNRDTFLFDIPKPKRAYDTIYRYEKLYFDKSLGLESLEKGFDSIQIRINYGCVMGKDRIIILINKNNNWTAEISEIKQNINPEFDPKIDSKKIEIIGKNMCRRKLGNMKHPDRAGRNSLKDYLL